MNKAKKRIKVYEIDVKDTYRRLPKGITCLRMITLQDHYSELEREHKEYVEACLKNYEKEIKEKDDIIETLNKSINLLINKGIKE